MRREGRQHGMVRTHRILPSTWNPKPGKRVVNEFDSPPTFGLFTKVPSKPTNHSKFTGVCGKPRCGSCHLHPACKSKNKTKGTQKLHSGDVVSNHKLITWRPVAAGRQGLKNVSGFSATGILDQLANDYMDDQYEDDEIYDDNEDASYGAYGDCTTEQFSFREDGIEIEEVMTGDQDDHEDNGNDDNDPAGKCQDIMSFYDVEIMLEPVEEEEEGGWCLVGENMIS